MSIFLSCLFPRHQNKAIRADINDSATATDLELQLRQLQIQSPRNGPIRYSYSQIKEATNNFDERQRVNREDPDFSFMKAEMEGVPVTIKWCKDDSRITSELANMQKELLVLGFYGFGAHPNLVKLRGWCYNESDEDGHSMFLVYDHDLSSISTLEDVLHNDRRCIAELGWKRRFNILLGVASAIELVHGDQHGLPSSSSSDFNAVIHRNIKSRNVLLDGRYQPKLYGFQFSFLENVKYGNNSTTDEISAAQSEKLDKRLAAGYLAPEEIKYSTFNKKTDIYSFGVLLAEVATGKRPIIRISQDRKLVLLQDWLREKWMDARLLIDAVDTRLSGHFDRDEILRVLRLALACTNRDPSNRPTMRNAIDALLGISPLPPIDTNY